MYVQGNTLQGSCSIPNLSATRITQAQSANRRTYDVTKVLNDYKMLFRKEEYFYGKDKINLLAYFEIDNATMPIEDVLAYSYTDTARQELARILNLFLYGHISAEDISRYLKIFCQTNQPCAWQFFHYLRFVKLMKFVSSFQAICMRNVMLDAKLQGYNDLSSETQANAERESDYLQSQRDAMIFNQTPRKTQFNSIFKDQSVTSDVSLRTVDDYTKHYQTGLAETVEVADATSRPGLIKTYWHDEETIQKEAATG